MIELQCANGFLKISVFEKDIALTILAALYIMQSKFESYQTTAYLYFSRFLAYQIYLDQPPKHQVR